MTKNSIYIKFAFFLMYVLFSTHSLSAQRLTYEETLPLNFFKDKDTASVYLNPNAPPEERALDVINRLTFEEKLQLTGGYKFFCFPGVSRLGLRPATMADASQGIRLKTISGKIPSTSYPGMLALAATWNIEIAQKFGLNMGRECRAQGVDILLGPGMNMQRLSVGGRNYEYMGEDPLLTSKMSSAYIRGLQSQKILATAKHFIANDQEFCRHIASSDVDERALREIYLPPWENAIKSAGLKSIMTGNNAINGLPAVMNKPLMKDIIRNEYGFTGITMSDWQNSNYHVFMQHLILNSGHSLLMAKNDAFREYVEEQIKQYPQEKKAIEYYLNQMVYRNLLPLFQMGVYDRFNADSSYFQYRVQEQLFAKKCAEEAICLLKNEDDILPVGLNQKILLTGGVEPFSGTGSGFVEGYKHTSFAEGLEKVYNRFTYQKNPSDNLIKDADVVFYNLNIEGGEGYDVAFIDSSGVNKQIFHLLELNKNVVILINACNGFPMPWKNEVKGILYNFFLGQERGNALANIISGKVNPSGRLPFTIEEAFKDSPDPDFNYLGGKPFWYGDNSYYKEYWKGNDIKTEVEIAKYIKPHQFVHIPYNEGVFIGYRWYQKYNKPYHFAFGYGLSYTQFKFDKPILNTHVIYQNDSISLSLNVKNTGKSAGSEVVQLYIGDEESTVERPVKELKAFQKVYLEPGESKKVNFIILGKDLAFWDIISHKWKIEEGKFTIYIGKSSDDNKMKETIEYINPFSG